MFLSKTGKMDSMITSGFFESRLYGKTSTGSAYPLKTVKKSKTNFSWARKSWTSQKPVFLPQCRSFPQTYVPNKASTLIQFGIWLLSAHPQTASVAAGNLKIEVLRDPAVASDASQGTFGFLSHLQVLHRKKKSTSSQNVSTFPPEAFLRVSISTLLPSSHRRGDASVPNNLLLTLWAPTPWRPPSLYLLQLPYPPT